MVNSPVDLIMSATLELAAVAACALPPAPIVMPQPPAQQTLPVKVTSASGVTPLVSYAVVKFGSHMLAAVTPVGVLNSYLATRAFSTRLPPEAIVPCFRPKAFDSTSDGSTGVAVMVLA